MKGWVGVVVVAAMLALGFALYMRPDLLPGGAQGPQLIYLVMTLLLVSGAAFGFRRLQVDRRSAFRNVVVWLVLIAVIGLAYVLIN